ncbi:hypothetical protein PMI04_017555 [Sphingobium sp. AP49]|uniref:hypothetical protein n=1 Tax=Sphingobium sp. AP49 TaxID=1144307 RepID=UPI00026ECD05|nr:hypothetical protein [Sphingobium sp. AP49]WHO38341.1 hypothetical protein PMI04_017555 [Sphingobium sp. AP49]
MEIYLAYSVALLATSIFVVRHGGPAGRWSVAGIWAGFILAQTAVLTVRPEAALIRTILAIECASLLLKIIIALRSTRRWPIIIAALQLNVTAVQLAVILSPAYLTKFFYAMSTVWAIPVLMVMAMGTQLDRKQAFPA